MPCHRTAGTGPTLNGPFVNWAQDIAVNPRRIFQPGSVDQVVAIVRQAEAQELSVHAYGSGWSFTNVMTSPGYMVDTAHLNGTPAAPLDPPAGFLQPPLDHGSNHDPNPIVQPKPLSTLSETLTGSTYPADPVYGALTPAARARKLCHVQAGIKVADLYTALEGIPSGVTTPDGFWHGFGVSTLGGSGGQAIAGVITTSTHGGDDHTFGTSAPSRPVAQLPDTVQGMRMVGPGGIEYFIQRAGQRAIVDPARLARLDPCLAGPGRIITDDDVFNAVVVSMGRIGVLCSLVLEVRPQYFLHETVDGGRWKQVIPQIGALRENTRFLQIVLVPYADYEQSTIGNNTVASTPFVVPDSVRDPQGGTAWVYFQGTDISFDRGPGTLWKVRDNGSRQMQIGNNTCASTPFVLPDPGGGGAWVYFQGTDIAFGRGPGTLWKVRDDGSEQSQIGNNTCASTPFVLADPGGGAPWVYFQGTDNTLWKVRDDGSQQSQIGGNTCSSPPFVLAAPGGGPPWVYFQGTDDTLWKVRDDGSQQAQIGGNTCSSTPFVMADPAGGAPWVYFQGTDSTLWKVRDDGTGQAQIGNNTTTSTPFVVADPTGGANWVYFQGTDTTLWRVRDDGSEQSAIGGNTTAATPFVTSDALGNVWVYFRGTDTDFTRGPGTLWKVRPEPDHSCSITRRCEVAAQSYGLSEPPPSTSLPSVVFNYACQQAPDALAAQVGLLIDALVAITAGTSIAFALLIPFVGPLLAAIDIAAATALIALLSPLTNPGTTIGLYLATAVNILNQLGLIDFTKGLVNLILGSQGPQPGSSRTDVSFRIMDTMDYSMHCYKAISLEVGFNADDVAYLGYIEAVFNLIDQFANENVLTGGYLSLRYCAGSEALLAIEQWPHTVCIEISALAHLTDEEQVLQALEDETMNHVGADGRLPTVHWGQRNSRTAAQIEATFPKLRTWRSVLARFVRHGRVQTFDNDFCQSHGLEVAGEKPIQLKADLSYLVPLLSD